MDARIGHARILTCKRQKIENVLSAESAAARPDMNIETTIIRLYARN